MNFKIINLQYSDIESADTVIKFSIVSAGIEKVDLLMLVPPCNLESTQKRIFAQIRRTLKDFKESGKITFFATPDNFLKSDTIAQYVFAMFPELKENLPEIKTGYDFIIVKH